MSFQAVSISLSDRCACFSFHTTFLGKMNRPKLVTKILVTSSSSSLVSLKEKIPFRRLYVLDRVVWVQQALFNLPMGMRRKGNMYRYI